MKLHEKNFKPAQNRLHKGNNKFLEKDFDKAFRYYSTAAGLLMIPPLNPDELTSRELLELAEELVCDAEIVLGGNYKICENTYEYVHEA